MTGARDGNGAVTVRTPEGDSTILFDSRERLGDLADPGRAVVVTEPAVLRYVPWSFPPERIVLVPSGEAAKSLACAESVYGRLLELKAGRDWTVLGVGGGSVSDLAGFVASTWMRGVDFGFVPTTVLSMVDASVGGKNGVDFRGFKNLVGTFRQPRFVLVDPACLASLSAADVASGLVEAVKHGVIEGPDHFRLLEEAIPPRREGEPWRPPEDPRAFTEAIRRSVELKARIVSEDPRESGPRRVLNLGHTVGHAVEAATGLPHGASVAAGLACSLGIAGRRGGSGEDAARVLDLLGRLGMPRSLEEARATAGAPEDGFREALAGALAVDKKRAGERVLFALPRALGRVEMESLSLSEIEEYVREAP